MIYTYKVKAEHQCKRIEFEFYSIEPRTLNYIESHYPDFCIYSIKDVTDYKPAMLIALTGHVQLNILQVAMDHFRDHISDVFEDQIDDDRVSIAEKQTTLERLEETKLIIKELKKWNKK
jgi:hypothetical protein